MSRQNFTGISVFPLISKSKMGYFTMY